VAETVLVTGTSSGFGLAIARYFAARGWNVAATSRRAPAGAPDDERVASLVLDVTDESSVAAAVAATVKRFGTIDVLVNNAGYGVFGPLEAISAAQLEAQFRTNVLGTAAMIRHVLPVMRARCAGTIVNMSSLAGRIADPFASAYDASQFAIEGLSESLRYELAIHGIRIKLIEPGHFKTDFIARSLEVVRHDAYRTSLDNWMAWVEHADAEAPDAEPVAAAVFRAATDRSARLRYPVQSGFFLALHALVPDRMWRSMVGAAMHRRPRPRAPAT
jgi:NAD(P)-dependent dehydrogenase (short-subunit alcohol dehydrogenase family)